MSPRELTSGRPVWAPRHTSWEGRWHLAHPQVTVFFQPPPRAAGPDAFSGQSADRIVSSSTQCVPQNALPEDPRVFSTLPGVARQVCLHSPGRRGVVHDGRCAGPGGCPASAVRTEEACVEEACVVPQAESAGRGAGLVHSAP